MTKAANEVSAKVHDVLLNLADTVLVSCEVLVVIHGKNKDILH